MNANYYLAALLDPLIRRLQKVQGRGWGGITTGAEASIALKYTRNATVIVDVGGNVGNWTAAILEGSTDAKVFIIEPSAVNHDRLTERFQHSNRVVLVPHALSDEDGNRTLFGDKSGSGLGSLYKREMSHFGLNHGPQETVSTISVDTFLKRFKIGSIDILKLDIEGHELSVLKAFTLEQLRGIRTIQFEFGGCNIDSRTYFQDFWYLLSPHFTILRLRPFGAVPVRKYTEMEEVFLTTNFLCIRRDE